MSRVERRDFHEDADYFSMLQEKYGHLRNFDAFFRGIKNIRDARNPFFENADVVDFVMMENGRTVERVSSIYDSRFGDVGFFGFYENIGGMRSVIPHMEKELKEKGCKKIIGPINLTTWHGYRFALDSAGHLFEPVNDASYTGDFQDRGYQVASRYYSMLRGDLDTILAFSESSYKGLMDAGFEVVRVGSDDLDFAKREVHKISNEIFSQNPGFAHLSFEEFDWIYGDLSSNIENVFFDLLTSGDKVAGYSFSFPDFDNSMVLKTMGVLPAYRAFGAGPGLGHFVHRRAKELGFDRMIQALMKTKNFPKSVIYDNSYIAGRYVLLEKLIF